MALEKELETYKAKLPELAASEGKYALVHGDTLVDVFGSYEDALREGYRQFGVKPFLVKQIHAVERVQFVTRMVAPCVRQPAVA